MNEYNLDGERGCSHSRRAFQLAIQSMNMYPSLFSTRRRVYMPDELLYSYPSGIWIDVNN